MRTRGPEAAPRPFTPPWAVFRIPGPSAACALCCRQDVRWGRKEGMRPFEVPGGLDVGRAGAARDSDGESLASRPDQQAPAGATRTGWAGRSPTPSLAHSLVPQAHRKHLLRAGPWAGGAACLMANGHVSDSARGGRLGDRGRRGRTRARTAGRPGCRGLRAFGGQGRLPPPPWKGTRSCSVAGPVPLP